MSLARSAIGFAAVGMLSTIIHAAVATLLIELLGTRPPMANGLAFVVATLFSYAANTRYSFGARLGAATAGRFALVACTAGLLSMGIAWLVDRTGAHYAFGIALVVVFVPVFSFIGHRNYTYR